jgi:hypothetical protein
MICSIMRSVGSAAVFALGVCARDPKGGASDVRNRSIEHDESLHNMRSFGDGDQSTRLAAAALRQLEHQTQHKCDAPDALPPAKQQTKAGATSNGLDYTVLSAHRARAPLHLSGQWRALRFFP